MLAGHRPVQQCAPEGRQPRWIRAVDRDSRQSICHPGTLAPGTVARTAAPAGPLGEPGSRAAKRAATAQRILDAAREEFGERGFEAATIRRIAQRANVDPSLVMQHYGSKAALFAIAVQLREAAPGEIEAHLHDVLDVRLAAVPPETKALVRSMLTAPEAAASMSAFLNERVANLSRAIGGDDADLRAALIVSSILGLTIARHFLKLDAFTRAPDADIARVARPWVTTGADSTPG